MNAQEIISSGILELYCTGLTSAAESAEVVQWAKQYPEVAAEIDAIQSGLESYARSQAMEPAALVKDKIFAAINTNNAAPVIDLNPGDGNNTTVRRVTHFWKYAIAACIVLLLGSLILNYTFYTKYREAGKELGITQTELEQQKELAKNMQDDMGVMTNKDAMHVKLGGMPDVPDATARIYWIQQTSEVYLDPSNLPEVPNGKQYQFWAIVDGKPVNGGIITTEINGKKVHIQRMKSFGKAQAFAVSLEDAGPEVPAPTKVISMGSL